MLTLFLVIVVVVALLAIDVVVTWKLARWLGSGAGVGRSIVVEGQILAATAMLAAISAMSPWADSPIVAVWFAQIVVIQVLQLGLIWYAIRRGFALPGWRAAAVLGMRIGYTVVGIALAVLLIRPYVIEAFSVASCSMSPAIRGPHAEAVCGKCRGTLVVPMSAMRSGVATPGSQGICQQCRAIGRVSSRIGAGRGQDRIIVNKMARPGRWEVAAYQTQAGVLICRVAGLPGETVHVAGGDVFINGSRVELPAHLAGLRYVDPMGWPTKYGTEQSPYTLKAGEYFLLGDFSAISNDSRLIGPVNGKDIVGVVGMRYWPIGRIGVL